MEEDLGGVAYSLFASCHLVCVPYLTCIFPVRVTPSQPRAAMLQHNREFLDSSSKGSASTT